MSESFAHILSDLGAYLAALTTLAVALGAVGHALSGIGTILVSFAWTPARGVGHVVLLVGGLLTSVYSHWGQIAAKLSKFIDAVKPKGPGAGGAAACLALCYLLGLTAFLACNSTTEPKTPAELGAAIREDTKAAYPVLVEVAKFDESMLKAWAAVSPHENEDDRAALAEVTDGLAVVRRELDAAKPWVENGEGEAAGKTHLRAAVVRLSAIADRFAARGVKLPKALRDGLDVAVAALGEGTADAVAPAPSSSAAP